MPRITILFGETEKTIEATVGQTVGEIVALTGLPLEQPCAGRGTCGKCQVLVESGVAPTDEIESSHLTQG